MITVLDVETTFQRDDKGDNPSPYLASNRLVSVGWKTDTGLSDYLFAYHETNPEIVDVNFKSKTQEILDNTSLLICHNTKFDLSWLRECGFLYEGPIWDTMLCDYVLARGQKLSLKLGDCCERYGLPQKLNEVNVYLDKGIGFEKIPAEIVKKYGIQDVDITYDLYFAQQKTIREEENVGLIPTINMSMEFCLVLIEMERNGIKIDENELKEFKRKYGSEQTSLGERLSEIAQTVMGDRQYNLNSPEQLSEILYSRRVKDKNIWKEIFNIGTEIRGSVVKKKYATKLSNKEFVDAVQEHTDIIFKEKANQCLDCKGRGKFNPITKKGEVSKANRICKTCEGTGIIYTPTTSIAGFGCTPINSNYAAVGGFKSDNDTVELLTSKHPLAKEFFSGLKRYAVLDTYNTSFIPGIEDGIYDDNLLHTQFMQAVTATGRLSSRRPNFHNQPRGSTFPLRRVVVSRWHDQGGLIGEADYAQLEFRCAVQMAEDEQGREDILSEFDIHKYTASVLNSTSISEVTTLQRQNAKPDTFKPLYGGTRGTPNQMEYYAAFLRKYDGINKYQQRLQNSAIRDKRIIIPSGREYAFPGAKRRWDGSSTFNTQIKNYPVQGFATADIVPCAGIEIRKRFKMLRQEIGLKSLLINIIHDSFKFDIYPGELDIVANTAINIMSNIKHILLERYRYDFTIPLDAEFKYGPNWMDTKKWSA